METSHNVFGEPLIACSTAPMTGFYRDGCCNTGPDDRGMHMVCAVMTEEFLAFSYTEGNDLSTPRPQWSFPGLKAGDNWCLCVLRWKDAYEAGKAPLVVLEATHERALDHVDMQTLLQFAYRKKVDQ
ncbi:MAG: DUF2237 domain-containing protein [Saprospiraceae bacterium]